MAIQDNQAHDFATRRSLAILAVRAVAVMALLCFCLVSRAESAQIQSVTAHKNGLLIVISGKGFGQPCQSCEVIADYGKFLYSVNVKKWSERQIIARLPDLGASTQVGITIRIQNRDSNTKKHRLTPDITPAKIIKKFVKPQNTPGLRVHEFRSQESLGEKGDISYDVSEPPLACGANGQVFDHAELLIGKRTRFGEAKIVEKPKKGCRNCSPLIVRYFYEPTGGLHYQLHVYRRAVEGVCAASVRK